MAEPPPLQSPGSCIEAIRQKTTLTTTTTTAAAAAAAADLQPLVLLPERGPGTPAHKPLHGRREAVPAGLAQPCDMPLAFAAVRRHHPPPTTTVATANH